MIFRPFDTFDFDLVSMIYEEGLLTGMSTFETRVPTWKDWYMKQLPLSRIAAFHKDIILGWTALSSVSSRDVYKGIADFRVYVSASSRGLGLGTKLLEQVILSSEENGILTLQSGVFRKNKGSIALHKKMV